MPPVRRRLASVPTGNDYQPAEQPAEETTPEEPTTTRRQVPRRATTASPSRPGTGWAAVSRHKRTATGRYPKVELGPRAIVAAFLEDEPLGVYYQHWITRAEGRKSFQCLAQQSEGRFLGGDGRPCPLCSVDERRPAFKALFNVAIIGSEAPVVSVLETGSTLSQTIADYAGEDRTSPINRFGEDERPDLYWALKRTESGKGDKAKFQFPVEPLKGRDLGEFNVEPLDASERDELLGQLYDMAIIQTSTYEELDTLVTDLWGEAEAA